MPKLDDEKLNLKHQTNCPGFKVGEKESKMRKRNVIFQCDVLLGEVTCHASSLLRKEVFPIMIKDEVGIEAQKDLLIVALGETWFRNCEDNEIKRKYYASQHMRLASKLLLNARKLAHPTNGSRNTSVGQIWDFIRLAYFEVLVKASLETSLPDIDDEDELKSPSNAIKLKYDLIRLAETKKLLSGIEYDKNRDDGKWKRYKEEAQDFVDAIKTKWSEKVTRHARKLLAERRLNKVQNLPKPEDIQQLGTYLVQQLDSFTLKPEDTNWSAYRNIVQYVQTRIVTYNKKRSEEVEAIKLFSYLKRKGIADVDVG